MSQTVLITGPTGFAGRHLVDACVAAGDAVVGVARSAAERVDLLDPAAARQAVAEATPDVVYHLAARSHVGRSWVEPGTTLQENTAMTLNLLEAVREEAPDAVVVVASSGEVYGAPAELPADESTPLRPQTPYAVSKAACDLLAGFYADAHGLRVVRARAFNHAGPGQPPIYAMSSLARQVAAGLQAGASPIRVVTGNPAVRRDYTDVRDVVRAYRALAALGEVGTFNVCSGQPTSLGDLVTGLAAVAAVEIEHVVDPRLMRPREVLVSWGSPARLHVATGWEPRRSLEQTLAETVAWWRGEIAAGRADERLHE